MKEDETGLFAFTAAGAKRQVLRLLDNPELAVSVGQNAQAQVRDERDISKTVEQWIKVFEEVVD
jgi:glycosyltransferase involved in cell wall biosynthesis